MDRKSEVKTSSLNNDNLATTYCSTTSFSKHCTDEVLTTTFSMHVSCTCTGREHQVLSKNTK